MKKALALFLGMLLLLTFVGCGPDNTETTETTETTEATQSTGDENVSDTSMLSSAKKLKTASSYRFSIISIKKSNGAELERRKEYLVVKNSDGTATIWNNKNTGMTGEEESSLYYEGNVGYIRDGYSSPIATYKHIYDAPVTMETVLSGEDILVNNGEKGLLALFDAMDPTVTRAADGILLEVKDMTQDQFMSLYMSMFDPKMAEGMQMPPLAEFDFYGRIDNNGYFREVAFSMTAEMEGQTSTQEAKMVVDQINSAKTEKPDFAKNYKLEYPNEVVYINNGIDAHYRCWHLEDDGFKNIVVFDGFGSKYFDDYTVEQYKVLTEVEGIPVTEFHNVLSNTFCGVKVKRIVIPSGMGVSVFGDITELLGETEFYFEDTKENARIEDAPEAEFTDCAKAVYYAGEWEYVDDIATPKK